MEVRCDKCQARYRVDDARIGPQGLTMRCGKCQNTFKVSRPDPQAAVPEPAPAPAAPAPAAAKPAAAPKPAARTAEPAPPKAAAPAPAKPVSKPAPAAAAKAAPAAAAPADEGAGRTMMFQTGNIKTPAAKPRPEPDSGSTMVFGQSPLAKPAAAPARPAPKPADSDAGSTMVFGQSPLPKSITAALAKPAMPKATPKDDAAGSTMMFGAAPSMAKTPATAVKPSLPIPAPAPRAEEPPPPAAEITPEPPAAEAPPAEEPAVPDETTGPSGDPIAADSGVEAEGAEDGDRETTAAEGTFDKAPPKGLLIGVAAGLAALLIAGGALVAVKKLGKHPPPQAAVEALTAAQAEADKDSLASLAAAESKAREALDAAGPKSYFPQATATLARIEIQWADALNDEAAEVAQKGGDGSDAKTADLQGQAKAKMKAAFVELLSPAIKADPKSPDLELALADYYRGQRSNSNMNKALKTAQTLKVDDARIALVQGLAAAQEDDGAEKAVPKLKAALAATPTARVHFRLALAYLALKDDANAGAELKETLKLSPQHERARAAQEQLAAAASADGKSEGK
jgi:predicted Zn finger-like uncharacterized protein